MGQSLANDGLLGIGDEFHAKIVVRLPWLRVIFFYDIWRVDVDSSARQLRNSSNTDSPSP